MIKNFLLNFCKNWSGQWGLSLKNAAFKQFYQKPEKCYNRKTQEDVVECANGYMRARDKFDALYRTMNESALPAVKEAEAAKETKDTVLKQSYPNREISTNQTIKIIEIVVSLIVLLDVQVFLA